MARTDLAGVKRLPGGTILVPGSRGGTYAVDLDAGTCTCPDHRYRQSRSGKGVACKHQTIARIFDELFPATEEFADGPGRGSDYEPEI